MEKLAGLARGLFNRVTSAAPLPEPEQIAYKPRPVTGFFAHLTDEQKAKALTYRGPENIGEAGYRLDAKA